MINSKSFIALGCLIAAAATLASAYAQQATSELAKMERQLTLKDTAETWSSNVCLGDLVSDGWIQSRCAVDKATCCLWNLGAERVKTFRRTDLQRELAKANFGGFALTLKGASEVTVTQTHRLLSVAEVREKLVNAVAAKLGDERDNVVVTSLHFHGPIYVSLSDESAWEIGLPEQLSERTSIKIVSTADGTQPVGWADATLSHNAEVFVAKRTIHPTDTIKVDDFEVRRANLLAAQANGPTLFKKDQFPDGVRARLTILPGAPLTSAAIERVPSVHLGDNVTLILRSDNLRISTKGVAQGNAAVGDMVTVQLQRYNRTFRGRLIEGKLVEVWL